MHVTKELLVSLTFVGLFTLASIATAVAGHSNSNCKNDHRGKPALCVGIK